MIQVQNHQQSIWIGNVTEVACTWFQKKKKKCHAHRNTKAGLGLQTDTRKNP